jgi:hypothetical protein
LLLVNCCLKIQNPSKVSRVGLEMKVVPGSVGDPDPGPLFRGMDPDLTPDLDPSLTEIWLQKKI